MNKFEEKRAERRKIILTEAKKLVLERGIYDGAMSELAVRAGISRQQLYNYYKNLDEVLEGIMEELVAHSYLARIADAAEVDTPENLIRYAILAFKDLSSGERPLKAGMASRMRFACVSPSAAAAMRTR